MSLILTKHAKERMKKRVITRTDLNVILAHGKISNLDKGLKCKEITTPAVKHRLGHDLDVSRYRGIKVIYDDKKGDTVVVTVAYKCTDQLFQTWIHKEHRTDKGNVPKSL